MSAAYNEQRLSRLIGRLAKATAIDNPFFRKSLRGHDPRNNPMTNKQHILNLSRKIERLRSRV